MKNTSHSDTRWTVVSEPWYKGKTRFVDAVCSCGTKRPVRLYAIQLGRSLSCGCITRSRKDCQPWGEKRSWSANKKRAHKIHQKMMERCYSVSAISYPRYGALGVTVCDRWRESFQNFWEDMGEPLPHESLDRIDNAAGYSPENCKWSTVLEQANNKKNNIYITRDGVTKTLPQWCREISVTYKTVWHRVTNLGWDIEEALTTPIRHTDERGELDAEKVREIRRRFTGKRGEMKELGREFGVTGTMISYVLSRKSWAHV